MSKLTLKAEGDTHVVVTRRFSSPPEAVYRAHTDAELVQKWMLGPEGWTMPVCICEAKPGGKIRYEWTDGRAFISRANFSNLSLIAGSFTSSGCTCPIRRPTTILRPDSRSTAGEHS